MGCTLGTAGTFHLPSASGSSRWMRHRDACCAGRYRTGVALYLACTAAVPLTVPFLGAVRYEIAMLAAGMIPVLIAAIAMSYRSVLGVLAASDMNCPS